MCLILMFNNLNDFDNFQDYSKFKICIVGDSHAGKTSILYKIMNKKENTSPTIGVDFFSNVVQGKYNMMKLVFWDLSGNPSFNPIITSYFKKVDLFIVVLDLTTDEVKSLQYWLKLIETHRTQQSPILVVANKIDMTPIYNRYHLELILNPSNVNYKIIDYHKNIQNYDKEFIMNHIIEILNEAFVEIDLNDDVNQPLINQSLKSNNNTCFSSIKTFFKNLMK